MKDSPLTHCPKDLCGKKRWGRGKVQRQLGTGAGMIFKGSGFYITDYRSEGYREAAKKDAPPKPPSAADPSSPKPEAKPAKPVKPAAKE
jgi:predicted nucleic acid-binding Zn ribbon protein